MSAAASTDPRSLWLSSPAALLQVLCCVAFCGHDACNFSSLTRAFRSDEVLWGCIKDRRGPRGRTVLMACSSSGDVGRARWLLDRCASVNAQTSSGFSSLLEACSNGHLEVVRELLGRGADVNAETSTGDTALLAACSRGHLEIALQLLGWGASVHAVTKDGWTSLMGACSRGHLEIARELLGRGANVNAQHCRGTSSLMLACKKGHQEVARLLLSHHAKRSLVDWEGLTACDHTPEANAELLALVKPEYVD